MIEIWHFGLNGETITGYHREVVERTAMAQAAARGTLGLTVCQPGYEYTLKTTEDNRFRWVQTITNKQAIYSETGIVPDGARRPLVAVIGPHEENEFVHSRWSIAHKRSFAEAPLWRLYWLICHRESTPEFDEVRDYFEEKHPGVYG